MQAYINIMWYTGGIKGYGDMACSKCGEVTEYKKKITHKEYCPTFIAQKVVKGEK